MTDEAWSALPLDLATLRARYKARPQAVLDVVEEIDRRIEAWPDRAVFISREGVDALRAAARTLLSQSPDPASLPLWGIPFAVKDNIDALGLETTAACPAFAYQPAHDARVVARLRAAGAIVVGKTNLDQFATGLNGTRSPYGAPRSVFNAQYISGGSSSGSAVAVAAGLVAFALGTDTAGSGRVPAAFNNIVGIKPTPGLVSASGVVPACRSLDCVSVFALSVADGLDIRRVMEGFDASDPFSRRGKFAAPHPAPRIGVPQRCDLDFDGDIANATLFDEAIARVAALGGEIVEFDYEPFRRVAALLYEGPWLAERGAAVGDFIAQHGDATDASVRALVEGSHRFTAVDAFRGAYELQRLKRLTDDILARVDAIMLPTAPTTYTVDAMRADPIRLNANLGRYTNLVNLLGMCAIAVPSGFRADGLPFGVTFIAPEFHDDAIAPFAATFHALSGCGAGRERHSVAAGIAPRSDNSGIEIAVVGAHLSGQPLNHELVALGGCLARTVRTRPDYRMFVLPNSTPPKPGVVRDPGFEGPGIEAEVWSLPAAGFGRFVAAIPGPLGIGKILCANGESVSGFLCESHAVKGAQEITHYGGWRAWRQSLAL